MTSKADKRRRRRAAREAALASIAGLPDDGLRNICAELGREIGQKAIEINELRYRLDAVRRELERRTTITEAGVHISDHAVLRYLERYKGMDMKSVREEIVAMAKRSGKLGSGEQYARRRDDHTGMTFGINEVNNTVTTVFSEQEKVILRQCP